MANLQKVASHEQVLFFVGGVNSRSPSPDVEPRPATPPRQALPTSAVTPSHARPRQASTQQVHTEIPPQVLLHTPPLSPTSSAASTEPRSSSLQLPAHPQLKLSHSAPPPIIPHSGSSLESSPSPHYKPAINDAFDTWDHPPVRRGSSSTPAQLCLKDPHSKESVLQRFESLERCFNEQFFAKREILLNDNGGKMGCVKMEEAVGRYVGTDHLENLVGLMEQLSLMQKQNTNLRRKCAYLEDMKMLYKVKGEFILHGSPSKESRMESFINRAQKAQTKMKHYLGTPSNKLYERMASDSSESPCAKQSVVDLDSSVKLNKRIPHKLHKRSQSVGSIDIVDSVNASGEGTPTISPYLEHEVHSKSPNSPKSHSSKKSKKFSKWMRVKKVLTGKPEHSKSLDTGTVDQLVRVNTKHSDKINTPMHLRRPSHDVGKVIPHIEAPASPHSVQSEPHVFPEDVNDLFGDDFAPIDAHSSSTPSTEGYPTLRSSRSAINVPAIEMEEEEEYFRPHNSGSFSDTEGTVKQQLLNVNDFRRRKSSPTLSLSKEPTPDEPFRRNSNIRETDLTDFKNDEDDSTTSPHLSPPQSDSKKVRSPWNRVKDIIHSRKDSLKVKNAGRGRTISGGEGNEADGEISPDSSSWEGKTQMEPDSSPKLKRHNTTKASFGSSLSPASSPKPLRRGGSVKGTPDSPSVRKKDSSSKLGGSPPVDLHALMGGMSEEFNKKMLEWEDKKKRGLLKEECENVRKGDGSSKFSEDFIKKMEEWERKKGLHESSMAGKRASIYDLGGRQTPEKNEVERPVSPVKQQEPIACLSESFSKTVQEWERVKETRAKVTSSPTPDGQPVAGKATTLKQFDSRKSRKEDRKEDRSKSRDRDRDKSKQRYEKERQKIEKKEKKIEQERLKLQELKLKLDLAIEHSSDGHHQAGLTDEFMKKLREWEEKNGLSEKGSHQRSCSEKQLRDGSSSKREGQGISVTPDGHGDDGQQQINEAFTDDCIDALIERLENENKHLRDELEEKEEDLAITQDELEQITCRFNMMNKEHGEEIELYKRELWASSRLGRQQQDTDMLMSTLHALQEKVAQLQAYDERVWAEKEQVELRALHECEARNKMESSLLYEIEQLQLALDMKIHRHGPEVLHQLYNYVVNIQDKLYDLRLGVIERNRVIENLKRHLLVQEVTNKLLVADMERKDLEVLHLNQQQKGGVIRRWRTFNGHDIIVRQDSSRLHRSTVFPPVPASCAVINYSLDKLSHGFGDSLDLHFEWLDGLKQQIKEIKDDEFRSMEVQTECQTTFMESRECQTVMTLCRSHYLPVSGRSTPDIGGDERSSQTSTPPLTPSSIDGTSSEPIQSRKEFFNDMKPIRYKRGAKLEQLPLKSNAESMGFDNDTQRNNKIIAQDKECGALHIKEDSDKDVSDVAKSIKNRIHHEHRDVSRKLKYEAKEKEKSDENERRKSTGGFLLEKMSMESDDELKHSQPPRSPIIRSKYPRKLKTTDIRIHQLYGDGRTWKATPPRRMLKQRKMSSDKTGSVVLSSGQDDSTDNESAHCEPMRGRTKSDSSVFKSQTVVSKTLSVPTTESTGHLYSSSRDERQPVHNLVSRYESAGALLVKPGSPNALRKPTVSPVRRLKTAAELLQDCEKRKRSKSATRDGCVGSKDSEEHYAMKTSPSDKENNKDSFNVNGSRVKELVKQLSRESTPTRPSDQPCLRQRPSSDVIHSTVKMLSLTPPQSESPKSTVKVPPLQDLTNEGQVKKLKDAFQSSGEDSPIPVAQSKLKDKNVPKEGTVSKVQEIFQAPNEPCSVSAARPAVRQPLPYSDKIRPLSCNTPRNSQSSGEMVWELAEVPKQKKSTPPPVINKDSKTSHSHKMFGKKHSSTGCSNRGAISTLCMQAASLELDDSSQTSTSGGEGTVPRIVDKSHYDDDDDQHDGQERKKSKFLEGNWLPKKFFRVSKC